jgi:molybdate transport system regulatory protein
MRVDENLPSYRIRVVFETGEMIGPGKAELLERTQTTGSIAAAGREMGMSYKRAWQLVETMNSTFREPVVRSTRGGARGGGAIVTSVGAKVLAEYRSLEVEAERVGRKHLKRLTGLLADIPGGK